MMESISDKLLKILSENVSKSEFINRFAKFLLDNNYLNDLLILITNDSHSFVEIYSFNDYFITQKDYLVNCIKQIEESEKSYGCVLKKEKYSDVLFSALNLKINSAYIFCAVSNIDKTYFDKIISGFIFGIDYLCLKENDEKYYKIFQNLDDTVFIHDTNGKIYDFNNKAEELLGLDKEIIPKLNFIELFHNKTLIKRKIEELKYYNNTDFDYHIIGTTGGKTDINISLKYYDKAKNLILAILKNISEKVWVEEALNRNLTLVLTLLETIPNPIYYTDENSIYLGCNDAFANFIGQPKEKIIGNKIEYVAKKDLAEKIIEINNEVLNAPAQTVEKEVKLPYPNGDEHYFISTITKFNMQGEKFSGLIGIMVDVTRQKKAEQKLNALYNNLKHELEIAAKVQKYLLPGWFIIKDDLQISTCYNPSAAIGGDLYDLIPLSNDKYVMYVADISGHGVQAALIMTAVKSIINILVQNNKIDLELHDIITHLNRVLMKNIFSDNYMTLLISLIDTKKQKISFFNAGHPPLLVLSQKTGKLHIFDKKGDIPIGWIKDYEYSKDNLEIMDFHYDSIYFFYTDGVYESQTKERNIMGFEKFTQIVKNKIKYENIVSFPHEIRDYLLKEGYDLSKDDFTLVALKGKIKNSLIQSFKLSYSELLSFVNKAIEFLKEKGFAGEKLYYFELVLVEILNNIFVHGINKDESTQITVEIEVKDDIYIRVWDILKEWTLPSKNVAKIMADNKYATQGRGFQIIYSLTKEVSLQRIADMNYLSVKI